MIALRLSAALAAAGLLAACSTAEPQGSSPAFGQNFVGVWRVTHAWPAGAVIGSPAPQGQTVVINPVGADDPLGRKCSGPTYGVAPGSVAVALGIEAPAEDQGLVLDITCEGRPFARYVALDGRLLSVADGWLFELHPAATVAARTTMALTPAPQQPAAPAAPVVPPPPAPAVKPAAAPAGPGEAVYLASYSSQANAEAGWRLLQRNAAILKGMQPQFREVDLGAKGRFIRLYAAAVPPQGKAALCAAVRKLSPDCGARY